jgi:hypothetical protein
VQIARCSHVACCVGKLRVCAVLCFMPGGIHAGCVLWCCHTRALMCRAHRVFCVCIGEPRAGTRRCVCLVLRGWVSACDKRKNPLACDSQRVFG